MKLPSTFLKDEEHNNAVIETPKGCVREAEEAKHGKTVRSDRLIATAKSF